MKEIGKRVLYISQIHVENRKHIFDIICYYDCLLWDLFIKNILMIFSLKDLIILKFLLYILYN